MKFIIIIATFLPVLMAEEKLKFVIIVHRHGNRSPTINCPTRQPPYQWEHGLGELTNYGKQQSYSLGKYLRNRYKGYLSDFYSPNEIKIVSSDVPRTLMTAYCVSAGLFNPKGKDVWSAYLPWQPIPVSSIPSSLDNLINFNYSLCPNYWTQLESAVKEMETVTRKVEIQEYMETLKEISRVNPDYKVPENTFLALASGHTLYDCLFIEGMRGLKPPEWAAKAYPKLEEMAKFFFWLFDANEELKKLHGGPLLRDISENLKKAAAGNMPKIYQYSAHDLSIVSLLQCMDVFDGELVPYLSAVIFELYRNEPGMGWSIKISYRKGEGESAKIQNLAVPGGTPSFEKFAAWVEDFTLQNWTGECNKGQTTSFSSKQVKFSANYQ